MENKTDLQLEIEKLMEEREENTELCPVCGEELYRAGHCLTCYSCGWSVCET